MTSKEFVVWMQGFVEACNEYSPTPKQWDTLKDKLGEVKDEQSYTFPTFTPNTTPMPLPYYPNPLDNPYKVTCTTGSAVAYGISTPYGYNPSSITYGYSSGSLWSYTSTLPQQPKVESNQLELDFEPK
jgi:hypothetical protein